ncbi:hypothetical protein BT63DRAFT_418995 [Microthyrium microscopicum]|uniref:Autophagy-related protein 2 n=1 Tax=Microthyrium microscopicum TaxID=703497 RepID=A0A6A6TX42_9PEZI|nr:hypothetical protein BT63DRAFT_418995 [Microthyrium microscopicum]
MASWIPSFASKLLPSSLQERVLLLALSQLEILDTDSLKLDQLKIEWGIQSSIELQDVGLHVHKISKLAGLPDSLIPTKGRIKTLRVTIPANIFASGIQIEVNGVEICIRSSRSPTEGHEPEATNEDGQHLPSTKEVAKNVLAELPEAELRKLEEAIQEQPATNLEDSDLQYGDEPGEGTGVEISLPNWIAGYLKGIVDRLQVTIQKVAFVIEFDVPAHEIPAHLQIQEDLEASIGFHVHEVDVLGITSRRHDPERAQSLVSKQKNKRRAVFRGIRADLTTNQAFFATLSRVNSHSSAISSPPQSQASPEMSRYSTRSHPESSDSDEFPMAPSMMASMMQGSVSESQMLGLQHYTVEPDDDVPEDLMSFSDHNHAVQHMPVDESDRFADASDDEGDMAQSMMISEPGGPRAESKRSRKKSHQSSGQSSFLKQSEQFPLRMAVSGLNASHMSASVHSERIDQREVEYNPMTQTQSSLGLGFLGDSQQIPGSAPFAEDDEPPSSGSDSSQSEPDEMSESKFFTHDEAESMMFESAMSSLSRPGSHGDETFQAGRPSLSVDNTEFSGHSRSEPPVIPSQDDDSTCQTPTPRSPANAPVPDDEASEKQLTDSTELGSGAHTPVAKQFPAPATSLETKTLFSLDEIMIMIPWAGNVDENAESETSDDAASEADSEAYSEDSYFAAMPGAFHDGQNYRRSEKKPQIVKDPLKSPSDEAPSASNSPIQPDNDINVIVGCLQGQMDLSAVRLLLVLAQRVLTPPEPAPDTSRDFHAQSSAEKASESSLSLSVQFKQVKLGVREHLTSIPEPHNLDATSDALVLLTILDAEVQIRKTGFFVVAGANIGRFTLGIPGQDIVKFGIPPNTTSSRVLPEPPAFDIELKYIRSRSKGQEVHIFTAPLQISVNMQKIDERLECYGGLSGVLDLSSSMASNSTMLAGAPSPKPKAQVKRLEASDTTATPQNTLPIKAIVMLDGMNVDIKGKVCGISLHSSSIQADLQPNGISVALARIKVRGPIMDPPSTRRPPVAITVLNTKVDFLFAPEEEDITALLSLLVPSRDPYEDEDDILVDTLVRQRKKGSVIRATLEDIDFQLSDLEALPKLQALGDELSKLSNVTKYLPEDDRPGILTLVSILKLKSNVRVNSRVGKLTAELANARLAHVGVPALLAFQLGSIQVSKGEDVMVGEVVPLPFDDHLPMLMGKIIGDEMEPTIKVKLFNVGLEYKVSTLMAFMDAPDDASSQDLAASMMSVATAQFPPMAPSRQTSNLSDSTSPRPKPMYVKVLIRDCAIGLNPTGEPARGILLLSSAQFSANASSESPMKGLLEIRRASLHAIDDSALLDLEIEPTPRSRSIQITSPTITDLSRQGYRSLGALNATSILVQADSGPNEKSTVTVSINSELFVLETCADSTQTLIQILDGLNPPSPPSKDMAYYTDPMPAEDLISAFSGMAYEQAEPSSPTNITDLNDDEDLLADESDGYEMIGSIYDAGDRDTMDSDMEESMESFDTHSVAQSERAQERPIPSGPPFSSRASLTFRHSPSGAPLERIDGHADQVYSPQSIHGWTSATNRYGMIPGLTTRDCPFKLELRVKTLMFNMFDGYDWDKTRQTITRAVEDVQARAAQRRSERQRHSVDVDDEESEIGDFLFQSIWIAVPNNKDEHDLRRRINREMDDLGSETGTTTTVTSHSTTRPDLRRKRSRSLKLDRSKRHKVSIEVRELAVDVLVLPPSVVETQSSINVKVGNLEIFDHVPTSTWRKFITYMHDAGPRPSGKPMFHIEIQNVKPKVELSATEMVIRATVLPLRLHVDQDTLDFITRFFEFKDSSREPTGRPANPPFIQRIEIRAVPIKLDYKPKKVDYAGLRSGRTKEFMNFVILDGADIMLKRLLVYGISGFDNMHTVLNDLWVNDVTRNQLPTVLQGLAPFRPIVNVGAGVRNLVFIPMTEYQKDGRLIRSIRKGALAFAKTTTSELARLGARVAIGTGNILQGAETMLSPAENPHEDDDGYLSSSPGRRPASRAVSSYANQPLTVASGLRNAARHLERDLMSARDAIIAVGTDIRESESAGDLVGAIRRSAPAVVLKPAIGTLRATGTALLGVGNSLDGQSRRRLEDKYK